MKKSQLALISVAAMGSVGGIAYLLQDESGSVKTTYTRPDAFVQKPQAMIAWRSPAADMALFFPGASLPDSANPKVVPLSRHRVEILKSLGPETPLDSNALYVFPVHEKGAVLLRRVAGEYGSIEVVVGIDTLGRVVGVHIQRHREPPEIEKALTAPTFLASFSGKTATSTFTLPPELPQIAKTSAQAVSRSVRALLIEYNAGTRS